MGNQSSSEYYLCPVCPTQWSTSTPAPELRPHIDSLVKPLSSSAPQHTLYLYLGVPVRSPTPQPGGGGGGAGASDPPAPPITSWGEAFVVAHALVEVKKEEAFFSSLTVLPEHLGKAHSGRFLAALVQHLVEAPFGVKQLWPRGPTEDSLEWVRCKCLAPAEHSLAAWVLLHGHESEGFPLPEDLPRDFTEALQALECKESGVSGLAVAARSQQWSLTALLKAWAMFLAQACHFEEEHALAVALLMGMEVFGDDAELAEGEEEEEGKEGEGEGEGEGQEGASGGEALEEGTPAPPLLAPTAAAADGSPGLGVLEGGSSLNQRGKRLASEAAQEGVEFGKRQRVEGDP
jgi:hypothetical protein